MKGPFILTFVFTLLIYIGINAYIFIRGWQAMEWVAKPLRRAIIGIASLMPLLFVGLFFTRRFFENVLIDTGWAIGSEWIAAMLYFLMAVIIIDLLRLVLRIMGKRPARLFGEHYASVKFFIFLCINIAVVVTLYIGRLNAVEPFVNRVELTIEKEAPGRDSLTVVLISDLHLGPINDYSSLQRWVKAINELSPEVVLIAGDIVDDTPQSMEIRQMGELLAQIKASIGVYYVQGNHEMYGDFPRTLRYIEACGITPLLDTALLVDNSFYLIGRLDRAGGRGFQINQRCKTLEELLVGVDHSKPLILIDHQPRGFDKVEAAGIDLQLSGHTHGGQLWPFTLLVRPTYELCHGHLQKGNTHFFVTEGLGCWGPKVRIGTRAEIAFFTLRFKP